MKKILPNIMELSWPIDSAEYWFTNISDYPWSLLLHSGYSNHRYGRFDIIVADPIGTILTYGNTTQVSFNRSFISLKDPFLLLKDIINKCGLYAEENSDIPFQGGALGLFGYDLGNYFENIQQHSINEIKLPDMAIGLYDWSLIFDHHKKQVLLLSYSDINKRLKWLKLQKKNKCNNFYLTTPWRANMDYKDYLNKFNRIKDYINNGDCYQINLAQRFQASYKGDEWQAFIRLNAKNNAPFSAFLRLREGVILSLSPERFIYLFKNKIQTRPIKGTIRRLSSNTIDIEQVKLLLNSSKDQAENLMIVDLMRNDIGRVAIPGTVKVTELFEIETFQTVHHMVSTITAKLKGSNSALDLLRAVFPGGSITGAPKIRAMEIIDELEPHRRNAWCGSLGYISFCGTMDTNIAIRTLIAFNGQLYCSAGGGIVADSKSKEEYQETLDKINSILRILKN